MKIAICASMSFERKVLAIGEELEKLGHKVKMPFLTDKIIGKEKHDKLKVDRDLIRYYYQEIKKSDAVLILNFDKNNIKNYIGGNTLMEIGFAYVLKKPIYLLNPIPKMTYSDEIFAMKPIILNGDLSKIK